MCKLPSQGMKERNDAIFISHQLAQRDFREKHIAHSGALAIYNKPHHPELCRCFVIRASVSEIQKSRVLSPEDEHKPPACTKSTNNRTLKNVSSSEY